MKKLLTFLRKLRYHPLVQTACRTRLPVYLVEGKERSSGHPLSFAFVGTYGTVRNYYTRAFLADGARVRDLGFHWIRRVPALLRAQDPDCALVIYETNRLGRLLIKEKNPFRLARFMLAGIPLDRPLKDILNNNGFENILRRNRKHGFSFTSGNSPADLDHFYHAMYLPYMKTRHKDVAEITPYSFLKKKLDKSEIFFIKDGEQAIAANFGCYKKDMLMLFVIGVLNGDERYMKMGVNGALQYFPLLAAHQKGCKLLHLGGTRPLLMDGLTRFKRSLRARVLPHPLRLHVFLSFKFLKDSPGLQAALRANPFVHHPGRLCPRRAVFAAPGEPGEKERLSEIMKHTDWDGLDGTDLFVLGGRELVRPWADEYGWKNVDIQDVSGIIG